MKNLFFRFLLFDSKHFVRSYVRSFVRSFVSSIGTDVSCSADYRNYVNRSYGKQVTFTPFVLEVKITHKNVRKHTLTFTHVSYTIIGQFI